MIKLIPSIVYNCQKTKGYSIPAARLILHFLIFTFYFLISSMGFEQYHEPANELPDKTRTFARMIVSLTEEAEAINWYEQRIALEKDGTAKAIMRNAQKEEMKHFSMDLEWLLRAKPLWREIAKGVLFTQGDIVKEGDEAEEEAE
jgi:hypothetical protein